MDREEVALLIEEWKRTKDPEFLEEILERHYWLVGKLANQYRNSGIPKEDLVAEGVLGLVLAMEKYDMNFDAAFSSYAYYFIRSKILSLLWNVRNQLKISSSHVTRFVVNLIGQTKEQKLNSEETINAIEKETNFSENKSKLLFNTLSKPIKSLSNDKDANNLVDYFYQSKGENDNSPDKTSEIEEYYKIIHKSVLSLDSRLKTIILDRWLTENPKTLEELAREFGVSKERIRQLELQAIEKLKESIVHNYGDKILGVLNYIMIFNILSEFFQPDETKSV